MYITNLQLLSVVIYHSVRVEHFETWGAEFSAAKSIGNSDRLGRITYVDQEERTDSAHRFGTSHPTLFLDAVHEIMNMTLILEPKKKIEYENLKTFAEHLPLTRWNCVSLSTDRTRNDI